ncbi:MAG TPA: ABC transporter permease [Verrucomicrobiae bacterium]|nr:ABC transporter permease [Verrucomicrobiae bacterium]
MENRWAEAFGRVRQVVKKELIQILRDRKFLSLVLVMPVIQTVIFGYVANVDVNDIPTAVCDLDRSRASRELVDRFFQSGFFSPAGTLDDPREADLWLDGGKARVVLVIPPGYSREITGKKTSQVQVLTDATNSNVAGIAGSYASTIVASANVELLLGRLQRIGIRTHETVLVEPEVRVWYNPELKSVNFMVPGLLCIILLSSTMNLTGISMVREKERGTAEQLSVTPVRSWELVLAKVLPFIGIGFINMVFVLFLGIFWFGVPLAGSLGLLFALSGVFIFTSLGLGVLISTLAATQQQAMMIAQFFQIPNMLLSGFMFPIANMPVAIQYVTYLVPLRYYVEIVRRIFMKGAGLPELWNQLLPLLVFGIVAVGLASLRFRKVQK